MIRKVVYRTNDSSLGENSSHWYGEDSYQVGERVMGKEISLIDTSYLGDAPSIAIWVGYGSSLKLFCEIPMTSVARIYYSLEDGE